MTALSTGNQMFLFILVVALLVTILGWVAIEVVKALVRGWRSRPGPRAW
jgi:antibiotic biosynthesis monooxygenase (ABM) superfamily enzyme